MVFDGGENSNACKCTAPCVTTFRGSMPLFAGVAQAVLRNRAFSTHHYLDTLRRDQMLPVLPLTLSLFY